MTETERNDFGQMGFLSAVVALHEMIVNRGEEGGFSAEFISTSNKMLEELDAYADSLRGKYVSEAKDTGTTTED